MTRVLQRKTHLSSSGIATLGEGLKVNSSLTDLVLVRHFCLLFSGEAAVTCALQNKNPIEDDGAALLGEILEVNTSLQELYLVRILQEFFVQFFFFEGHVGCVGEGVDCCDVYVAVEMSNRRLRSFWAGKGAESQQQPAGARSCEAFSFACFSGIDAGMRPTAVTYVLQGNNEIGDSGVKWLGEGLEVNSRLEELDIVRHHFAWLLFFSQEMKRELNVVTFVLQRNNRFGDAGVMWLAKSLRMNRSLKILDIVRLCC